MPTFEFELDTEYPNTECLGRFTKKEIDGISRRYQKDMEPKFREENEKYWWNYLAHECVVS
ncbi:MAG: hypothetical protein ABIH48_00235 [Candidatus Falkowbacteria bacterium]